MRRYGRIAASMLASFLLQARNLVISLVVFRLLDDPRVVWGLVNQVNASVTLLSVPARLGLEFAAVQMVAKHREDAPRSALAALLGATAVRVGLALLFGLPLVLFPSAIAPYVGLGDVPGLVRAGGWLLVSTSLYEFGAYVVSASDAFGAMLTSRLLYAGVNIALIAWIAASGSNDAEAVVASQTWSGAAACVYLVWVIAMQARALRRRANGQPSAVAAPEGAAMVRQVVRFAVPLTAVAAAGQVFTYLDRVLLPLLASREDLGSYSVASSVVGASLFGTYAFRNVARTRLPSQLARDPDAARETLRATYRASLLVAAWIAAGLVAVAPDLLVVLYGPEAVPAAAMLPWFVPYVLLTAHASFSTTALVSADQPSRQAWLTAGAAALNALLNLVLMPWIGPYGAIAAATLASVPLAWAASTAVNRAYGHRRDGLGALADSFPFGLRALAFSSASAAAGAVVAGPTLVASVGAGCVLTVTFAGLALAGGEVQRIRAAL